ncbi:UDP-glycosyltransferase 71A15-like [Coffea arabica]|uniref:Glycosyltransferase n=1 Tax=Coffea arabica TaxID=13443 RepID=A0ABM4UKG5_COFAR
MKAAELVFVPSPGRGHIVAIIEFAKRLLQQDERLSVSIIVIKRPYSTTVDSDTADLAASNTNIRFIYLPQVDPPVIKTCFENSMSVYIEMHKSHVKAGIIDHVLSKSTPIAGLVIDLFCSPMIDVANELDVPSYLFFTSSAAFLGLMLYLPIRHSEIGSEFFISDPDSIIPTFANPVPSRFIPSFLLDKDGYASFLSHGTQFIKTKGFIINTFAELEPHAIKYLTSAPELPPVYTVGPVLSVEDKKKPEFEKIMQWLDNQPSSSVVFLCFGSLGGFEKPQLEEIATALEWSGLRFLWSVRPPPPKDFNLKPVEYTNFSDVLPAGFLDRTENRGLVCGWAPQVEVLAHEAVGGFVSHCGWNSTLESLWNGVPIAAWPVYAEQQPNAFQLVNELKLAVELKSDYRITQADKLVMAEEIEKSIKSLMDTENPVRKRAKEIGEKAGKALLDGGSSFISLGRFIDDILITKK